MGDGEQKKLPADSPYHSGETVQEAARERLSMIPDVTEQWQADGQGVPIPDSQQDIGNLSNMFGRSLDPGSDVELFGSLAFRLPIKDFDVASAVVQHFQTFTTSWPHPKRCYIGEIGFVECQEFFQELPAST